MRPPLVAIGLLLALALRAAAGESAWRDMSLPPEAVQLNRTAAAAASHLSRSVFYQRLTLIADLLGADLDDGETLSALHLALLAHGR